MIVRAWQRRIALRIALLAAVIVATPISHAAARLGVAAEGGRVVGAVIQARSASVAGVVYDSLADSPLANADVQLLGDGAGARVYNARTDSAGRFVVDAVAEGNYLAGFFHPRVDSLGIDIPPIRFAVALVARTEIRLASPSRRTIIASLCPTASVGDGGTLLMGAVRDAATGDRLSDAVVSVQWTTLAFRDSGLASVRQGGVVPATPDGHFAVCGLPLDADLTVRAAAGSDTSGAVALQFPTLGILAHDILIAPRVSEASSASATLTGQVVTEAGAPVARAELSLWGYDATVRTTATGVFVFPKVPGGSSTLEVRAVGFEPVRRSVDLRSGEAGSNVLRVVVARAVRTLAPVTVFDTRVSALLRRSGFEQRRTGGFGRFVHADELEKMHVASTTTALARFPGMLTRAASRGSRIFMRDPKGLICSPTVWVDGAPYSSAASADVDAVVDIDVLADPSRIAGIEIYQRISQAPLQFAGTTKSACGVIVIWLKVE
ncbi:MAG: carboxypeptidase-like regulatory domain-containing protein [Gemmatimonadota bacterium]